MRRSSLYARNFIRSIMGILMVAGLSSELIRGGLVPESTGIPFTDPVRLRDICGIENDFQNKPELSSDFIYRLIDVMGGPRHFYKHYYIGAVSPLGFVKNGKNFN